MENFEKSAKQSQQIESLQSVSGRFWCHESVDSEHVEDISKQFGLDSIAASLLARRIASHDERVRFLNPKLQNDMPAHPDIIKDVSKAVKLLLKAVQKSKKIAIYGDYDVDGVCSIALFCFYFKTMGVKNIETYIPDRIHEGYGLNKEAIDALAAKNVEFLLILDCASNQIELIDHAKSAGMQVVIIDHHQISSKSSPDALINPFQQGDNSNLQSLCTAGLVFIVIAALNRLRKEQKEENLPDIRYWLTLVALATIADVVPLIGLNRTYVTTGLRLLAKAKKIHNKNLPLILLAQRVNMSLQSASARDFAFSLCPLLNAAGRMSSANHALDLLLLEDHEEIIKKTAQIIDFNKKRQDQQHKTLQQANEMLALQKSAESPSCVIVAKEGWHPGVIGITAAHLQRSYACPALVISWNKNDIGIGSARSIEGVSIGLVITKARENKLILQGGGHSMAAGFKIERNKYQEFSDFIRNNVTPMVQKQTKYLRNKLHIDIKNIDIDDINHPFYKSLARLQPYGKGNPEPVISICDVSIKSIRVIAKKHISCFLQNDNGAAIKAIAFSCLDNDIGRAMRSLDNQKICVAGVLQKNLYKNKFYFSFCIEDIAFISKKNLASSFHSQ